MSLTYTQKQKMLRTSIQASFPYLIEIVDENNIVYRYANSDNDIEYNENTYEACCFEITPPEKSFDNVSDASINISGISGEWIGRIRNQDERFTLKFIATINEEGLVTSIEEEDFTLTNAEWGEQTISWNMLFDELYDMAIPSATCNEIICPALS